jgi:DNA-binding Lrp family transcriptional regulator
VRRVIPRKYFLMSNPNSLDAIDWQILKIIACDARLSLREVARRIGMAAGTVTERIARLEANGVIRGYHADIDPAALGYGLEAMIGLQTVQGPALPECLQRIQSIPEVERVDVVTGTWDLVVRVRVRDHQHLREVVLGPIWRMPDFRHSETLVVLDSRTQPASWNVALEFAAREGKLSDLPIADGGAGPER